MRGWKFYALTEAMFQSDLVYTEYMKSSTVATVAGFQQTYATTVGLFLCVRGFGEKGLR